MNIDFTLHIYSCLLLALRQAGYAFYTFEDWCEGKASGRYVILRHDVDLKADHSLATARIEAEMGIRASYYFRVVPQSNQPAVILAIAALGHEIGYHYEDLSLMHGDAEKALQHFKLQLDYFRRFYPVRTICMHGSPRSKWDNRDLWKTANYRDFGIIGEPYFDFLSSESASGEKVSYFTDTARMWDGDKYNVRDKIKLTVDSGQLTVDSEQLTVDSGQLTVDREQLLVDSGQLSFPKDECNLSENHKSDKEGKAAQARTVAEIDQSTILRVHSTFDFIDWLETMPPENVMMITTHPQRWTDNRLEWVTELLMQGLKNFVKRLLYV